MFYLKTRFVYINLLNYVILLVVWFYKEPFNNWKKGHIGTKMVLDEWMIHKDP